MYYGFDKNIKQQKKIINFFFPTLIITIIIINVYWISKQLIIIISEESCDTKDWSNDCWWYIKIATILNNTNISQYYCFYCIFDNIYTALVSCIKYLFNFKIKMCVYIYIYIYIYINHPALITFMPLIRLLYVVWGIKGFYRFEWNSNAITDI